MNNPNNRFYHFVLQPSLNFDKDGNLIHDQEAVFKNLPHSALLTLIMDTPQSWLLEAVGNNHDLDNIHLGQVITFFFCQVSFVLILNKMLYRC